MPLKEPVVGTIGTKNTKATTAMAITAAINFLLAINVS